MHMNHIARVDLNLLVALDVLLKEENVSRAAARLGITQSAMSRSLARLRTMFDDELLVRTGRGMRTTRRADELASALPAALADLEALVTAGKAFDPATARRRFVVVAVDYAQVLLLAPLARRLEREAPGVDLYIRQPHEDSERELESRRIDGVIAPPRPSGAGVVWTPLHDDGYTTVVWERHPLRKLTLKTYAELEHVFVAPWGRPGGVVDDVLAGRRLMRRVAVQVPTFLFLPHVLVGTRRIATVPTRVATLLEAHHPLRRLAPPIPIPRFTMSLGWHELHRDDPGHQWLRRSLAELATEATQGALSASWLDRFGARPARIARARGRRG